MILFYLLQQNKKGEIQGGNCQTGTMMMHSEADKAFKNEHTSYTA